LWPMQRDLGLFSKKHLLGRILRLAFYTQVHPSIQP
jgi:hypothetical protein